MPEKDFETDMHKKVLWTTNLPVYLIWVLSTRMELLCFDL
jgi:hypothetical protein